MNQDSQTISPFERESITGISLSLAGGAEYIQPRATSAEVETTGAYACQTPADDGAGGAKRDGSIDIARVTTEAVIAARCTNAWWAGGRIVPSREVADLRGLRISEA
jgi:hypothetical protein